MNSIQRQYDLGLLTINFSQRLNPFDYFKSLELIKSRKTEYPSIQKFNIKKIQDIPYKNYYVIESNKKYNLKIKKMDSKPVIPKMNSLFKELNQRIKESRERNKEIKEKALTLDNKKYNKRIKEQKPKLLKANYLEKIFRENHDKYIESLLRNSRFRKNADKSNEKQFKFKLPDISKYKNISAAKLHSKTEYNLDADEPSKDNSIEQKDHKHTEISHNKQGHLGDKNYNS